MNPWLIDEKINPPQRENIVIDADFDNVDPLTKQAATVLLDYTYNTHGYNPAITSGYRDPERNAAVGGVANSYHIQGKAIDLDLSGLSPEQIADIEAKARQSFGEVLYHDVGSGIHLHAANPIEKPQENNIVDNLLFSKAAASPAPTTNPWLADIPVKESVQPVTASQSANPWLADVTTTQPAATTPPPDNQQSLPALFDEMGTPIINTADSGLGKAVNQYFAEPVASAVGTVLEYADKPRGAIAGAAANLQQGKGIVEGLKRGWQENVSYKELLPKDFQEKDPYFAASLIGLASDVVFDPIWLATPAKAVSIVKRVGSLFGAEKAVAPVISAIEKAKSSEQVQAILNKEIELSGVGNVSVKRMFSEEGPLSDLLDKLKIDRAKMNEQVAEAGKVLDPLDAKQRENVTRMIEAKPAGEINIPSPLPIQEKRTWIPKEMDEYFDLVAQNDKIPVKEVLQEHVKKWTDVIKDTVTEMRSFDKKGSSGVFYNDFTGTYERVIKSKNEHPAVQEFVTKNGRMPKSDEWYRIAEDFVSRDPESMQIREMAIDAKDYLDRLGKETVAKPMQKTVIDSDSISEITKPQLIEKMVADGFNPNQIEQVTQAADSLSRFSTARSGELLKRNIISQETYDKYYGRYIRREYLKHENPEEFIKQLREAGKAEEANKLQQTIESINRNYTKRSGVTMNWNDIKQRQTLTEAEQEALGRVMDATHPFAKGGQVSSELIARYDFLDEVGKRFAAETEQPGFRLMEGKRFGPLEGKWVPKEIFNEVSNTIKPLTDTESLWRQAVGWWKMGKTILNPAGHARNFMSNALLLDMAGMPTAKVPVFLTRAAKEMLDKGKYFKEAKENTTLLLNTFKESEALNLNKPGVIKSAVEKAGDLYQGNETLGKLAAYMYAREGGKDIATAAKFANDALFDYSKVPPIVDYLRRSGLVPFASFPYFATKATAKALYKDPATVLKYYKPMVAGKTEEQRSAEKLYPKWMQHYNYLPIGKGTVTKDGKTQELDKYLDVSFIYPFDSADVSVSPAFTLAASLAMNKNWLTGQEIAKKGAMPTEKATEYFKYAAQQLLPSFAPFGYSQEKLFNSFTGKMDKLGRQYSPAEAVAHTILGLKNVPIDTGEIAKKSFQGMKRDINDIKLTMRDVMRDKRLSPEEKKQKLNEYKDYMKQIAEQSKTLSKAYLDVKKRPIE